MKPQGIELSWIVVKDIKGAIKYYTHVIGLDLKEYNEEYGWAELSGPNGSLLGIAQECPENDTKAGTNAVLTITVQDINKTIERYRKEGVQLVGEVIEIPGHVKMQTFRDKDGNTLQIVQKLH